MVGSNSSVHGGDHRDEEPPVVRAELRQMANSLLAVMERMFNERLPAAGGRGPQHQHEDNHREEFGDENSGLGAGFHGRNGNGRGGQGERRRANFDQCGGGRRAEFDHQRGGGRGRDRRVHFDDEDEVHDEYEEGFDDNENPFGHHGHFGQPHEHRRGAGHDGENHRGRRNRDDPDSIARVKLSVPKFSGKENADAYLEWEEQCDQIFRVHNLSDQRRVNLDSVEFLGYALT